LFDMSAPAEGVNEAAKDWQAWLSGDRDRVRLWIEVDRSVVASQFVGPEDLRRRYRRNMETREFWPPPKFIQYVEAGHIGPVPLDAASGVMFADAPGRFEWCGDLRAVAEGAARFAANAPPNDGIAARMEAARRSRLEREAR
jgi:hypothetical protein